LFRLLENLDGLSFPAECAVKVSHNNGKFARAIINWLKKGRGFERNPQTDEATSSQPLFM
jgi:hypothetical protein